MNHYRTVLLVVFANIFEFEALRQVVVNLDSTELPTTTDSVLYHEVQLRTIEGSLTIFYACRKVLFLASVDDCLFCHCPNLVGTNILGGVVGVAERNLCFEVLEIESLEDDFNDFHNADKLLLNLVLTTEDMCIVLCERTNAGKSVQFARLLVAVNCTEFSNTQRQILVAAWAVLENHTVVRAVHRLEQVHFTFFGSGNRLERVLAVVVPVT